jgi:phospholipase/lecithinase/hemolysin
VVFGTSLSDPGNAAALAHSVSTPPDYSLDPLLIPAAPYARGGQHLTNGATWIEQLAQSSGLSASVRPAFRGNSAAATNYAVAGARAGGDGHSVDLTEQVGAFLQDVGGVAPSNALYVIEMGANDIREALAVIAGNGDGLPVLGAALMSIGDSIATLYAAGARNFLVWNVPNLGATPALQIADTHQPGAAQLATFLTTGFNDQLAIVLTNVSLLPGINLVSFDAYALINEIIATPGAFGLSNVSTACVTPRTPPFACRNPDQFLFWDGIHPTKAAHAIIAQAAAVVLGE